MSNPIDEVKFLVGKHGIAGAYEHLESDAKYPEERMYQNFRRECKRYLDGYVAGLRLILPALDQVVGVGRAALFFLLLHALIRHCTSTASSCSRRVCGLMLKIPLAAKRSPR